MPNQVYIKFCVAGPKEELTRFCKQVSVGKWDFNILFPNPLEKYNSPPKIMTEPDILAWKKEMEARFSAEEYKGIGIPMTKEESEQFTKQYGTNDWYEWAHDHWGSKWGFYDINLDFEGDNFIVFECASAWSVPEGLLAQISAQFPTLCFHLLFVEEAWFYGGEITAINGQLQTLYHENRADVKQYQDQYFDYDVPGAVHTFLQEAVTP